MLVSVFTGHELFGYKVTNAMRYMNIIGAAATQYKLQWQKACRLMLYPYELILPLVLSSSLQCAAVNGAGASRSQHT